MLIEGDLAARRELDREQLRMGGVLVAGFATGVALGQPLAAGVLAIALLLAWRFGGFAGVFAVCLGALALASSSIADVKTGATDVRWVALGTLAVWPAVSGRRLRIAVPRLLLAGGAGLALLGLVSIVWSIDPGLTARRSIAFTGLVFVALIVVPVHAATRAERRAVVAWLAALCGAGAVAAVVAAIVSPSLARATPTAFATVNGLPDLPSFGPLRAWMESPQTIGIWCALLLPFLVAWRRPKIAGPLAFVAVGVALWSYSRAAMVLLVMVLAWVALINRPRRAVLAGAALAGIVLAVSIGGTLVTNTALTKFQRAGSPERSLLGGRLEAWDATLDLVAAAPAGGYGFGTGDTLFHLSGADRHFVYFNAANSADGYLQALVEVGPLGVLAILAVFAGAFSGAARTRSRLRGPFLMVAAGFAAVGVTESVFTSPGSPFTLLMWSCLALAASPVLKRDDLSRADGDEHERVGLPEPELVPLLARPLEEERVVPVNGRRNGAPVGAGGRNGNGHLVGVEIREEREAQGRIPGDRPA